MNDDIAQACEYSPWNIGDSISYFARAGAYRLADHGEIAQDGVVGHRSELIGPEVGLVLLAPLDCLKDVGVALCGRTGSQEHRVGQELDETSSRNSDVATTSTLDPRTWLSSSATPATRSRSFPPPGSRSTSRSMSLSRWRRPGLRSRRGGGCWR